MNRPKAKKGDNALKNEVSPIALAAIVGALAVLVVGYLLFQKAQGPKILTGNKGATVSHEAQEQHTHTDPETGRQVTHD